MPPPKEHGSSASRNASSLVISGMGNVVAPADSQFLERAWSAVADAAATAGIAVILGTGRFVHGGLVATALVVNADGSLAGFQDKVQIDPSEEDTYTAGSGRHVFQSRSVDVWSRHLSKERDAKPFQN